MSTTSIETTSRPTATIYQFPQRGRMLSATQRGEAKLVLDTAPRIASSGWYHEAAIDESRRAGK